MSRLDSVVIHDGRGNAISMDRRTDGGSVTVEFNGPVVCLKSIDRWGDVREQKCIAIPAPTPPQTSGNSGSGGSGSGSGSGNCGCP